MEQPACPSSLSSACHQATHRQLTELLLPRQTTPAAMDMSFCSPLQLQDSSSFLFDCESLLDKSFDPLAYDPASDPGYVSACSSLSPTSSVDSFCFSPTSLATARNEVDALDCFIFSSPAVAPQTLPHSRSSPIISTIKQSRSRYPGKKRQTASEREKLRMRDLTKALHHLRMYLPASVAPAGQTLTKIETLRLTIRYISYLSAQLGLTEEMLEQRRSSCFVEQPQSISQMLSQSSCSYSAQESASSTISPAEPAFPDQLASLQHSCQVSSGFNLISEQYWMPQQQLQSVVFPGQS